MPTIDLTLQTIAQSLGTDADYTLLFGSEEGKSVANIKMIYRRLLRSIHPDVYQSAEDKRIASDLFARVESLYQQALVAVTNGSYGRQPVLATITTRTMTHVIRTAAHGGDIADGFIADSTHTQGAHSERTFVKIARNPRDADLIKAEAAALKKLHADGSEAKWFPYVTELQDSFIYAEGARRRPANVLTLLDGFYTLKEVRERCGGAVRTFDAIWMWRRILMALGFAHENGVVHGAVLPEHIMIWPEEHGVVLTDWCYSRILSDTGYDPIVALVGKYKEWYPPEVLARHSPSPSTDLVMAARLMIWLMGGNPVSGVMPESVPMPIRAFLKGCLSQGQFARPQNAWLLLREFDELLERLGRPFYPRRFRVFTVPAGSAR